jgi:hypothetical protein
MLYLPVANLVKVKDLMPYVAWVVPRPPSITPTHQFTQLALPVDVILPLIVVAPLMVVAPFNWIVPLSKNLATNPFNDVKTLTPAEPTDLMFFIIQLPVLATISELKVAIPVVVMYPLIFTL